MSDVSDRIAPQRNVSGTGWLDRLIDARDRLLVSPNFQKFAATFPLTRGVARRQARAAFDICAGFVYSQILFACVELGIFELLASGPKSLPEIARNAGLSDDATARLLSGAVALKLLERRSGERFGLGMLGAAMGANAGIKAMIAHHHLLYADLANPVALLKGEVHETKLRRYWAYNTTSKPSELEADDVTAYSRLMSASQSLVSGEILDAYEIGQHKILLDVGGGEGTFLRAAAQRAANLNLWLFDLPAVARRADAAFASAGLTARSRTFGGNFFTDELPRGADAISLVRVVHDHDDAAVMTLLSSAHRALPADGTLIIAEPLAETPGAETMGDAYFGFYLLAMGNGRPRSFSYLSMMLKNAGFHSIRQVSTRTPLQTSLVIAHR